MRESIAAIALIRRQVQGQSEWLAQWNEGWNAFNFVGGHKHDDESFRECVIREVTEELGLRFESEFFVAGAPFARLRYTAWSARAQQETQYTIELFEVTLTEAAQHQIDADSRNRWLCENEIRAQRSETGEPVSETMELLLTRARLIAIDNPKHNEPK